MLEKHKKNLSLTMEYSFEGSYAISPIIVNGDCVGTVMICSKENTVDETIFKITQIISEFIKKNIET